MITVFTATYNRGYIIENLYHSLKQQTMKDFEWIIVDDGSTDNTKNLIEKWKNETTDFSIRYKKVSNGGKHRAINIGVSMASTDAFFIVDSDDYLVDNAIEQVQEWFSLICEDPQFAGISGLKGNSITTPLGGWGTFSNNYIDATNLERKKYGLLKDKAEVYKTSILKKYPFPEFEGENFITEGIVWNKIAKDGYKIRWYKKVIYICEYLEDGLTRCGYMRSIKNPHGYMAYLNLMAQIYGKKYSDLHKFGFFFVLRSSQYDIDTCSPKMQISLLEAHKLEESYKQMLMEMKDYFVKHNLTNIAIYGLGNVGNAFLAIADTLDLNVEYAIDIRQIANVSIPVYLPTQDWPAVDAVLITLKDYNDSVTHLLQEHFDSVIYWRDLSSKYWCD